MAISRECERLQGIVNWCCHTQIVTPKEALALTEWLERADAAIPAPPPAPVTETRVVLPGTGKRKRSRAERRHAEREAEHQRQVSQLFGPRPLLPHEVEEQRGYGHGDGF